MTSQVSSSTVPPGHAPVLSMSLNCMTSLIGVSDGPLPSAMLVGGSLFEHNHRTPPCSTRQLTGGAVLPASIVKVWPPSVDTKLPPDGVPSTTSALVP